MTARIFKPSKGATMSGTARTKQWMLVFDHDGSRHVEPLMGWTSTSDTKQQLRLAFDSKEEAIAYCARNGIPYRVDEPREATRKTIAYADNFKYNRTMPWTH
ncbi:MAG TPA: ETC complex I subunit [Allosphingosinicella sp.]|jgi:hypothetical protein|nr:ETC complex I subunit [Allosphingosinicella sp.]